MPASLRAPATRYHVPQHLLVSFRAASTCSCLVIAPSRGLGGHSVFHNILFTRLRAQAVGQGAQGDGKQSELWPGPCIHNPQDPQRMRPQPSKLLRNSSLSASGMDDGESGCNCGEREEGGAGGRPQTGGRGWMARGGCGAAGILCQAIPARRRPLPSPIMPLPPPGRMACQRWERVWRRRPYVEGGSSRVLHAHGTWPACFVVRSELKLT